MTATTASDYTSSVAAIASPRPGLLTRWWRRRAAERRRIEFAAWLLHENYGQAAFGIARVSSRQPIGFDERRFWRKVASQLRRLESWRPA